MERALRKSQWFFWNGMVLIALGFGALMVAMANRWWWLYAVGVASLFGGIALVIYSPRILRKL